MLGISQLSRVVMLAALAGVLVAACAGAAATPGTPAVPSGAFPVPTIAPPLPTASALPSIEPTAGTTPALTPVATATLIPEGTYVSSLDLALVTAFVNTNAKLTAAQKADVIKNFMGGHKTITVTIDLHGGNLTQSQAADGGAPEVGLRATYAFPDDHTLVFQEQCCGTSTFAVVPRQNGFSLSGGSAGEDNEDAMIGWTLFEGGPFTLAS